jgi:hypothetical protein
MVEETFHAALRGESAIMKGINSLPPLLGYVGTPPKRLRVCLAIASGRSGAGDMAVWMGKSVAFTSDARQRWAAGWLGWSGFSSSGRKRCAGACAKVLPATCKRWSILIRAKAKFPLSRRCAGQFHQLPQPQSASGRPRFEGPGVVARPDRPRRYEASFECAATGHFLVNIRTQRGGKTNSQITGGVLPYSPEYNAIGTNAFLLSRLSDVGGGELLKTESAGETFSRARALPHAPHKTSGCHC